LEEITLGNNTYTAAQAFEIFGANPSDPLVILAKNLIQIKLNLACQHSPNCTQIQQTVVNADFLIGDKLVPPFGPVGQLAPGAAGNVLASLRMYERGELCGAESCGPDSDCPDP
jgi:hypothetical protein